MFPLDARWHLHGELVRRGLGGASAPMGRAWQPDALLTPIRPLFFLSSVTPASPLLASGLGWSALLCSCLPMFTEELGCTVSSAFPIPFPQLNAHQVMKVAVSGHSLNQLDCLSPAPLAAMH